MGRRLLLLLGVSLMIASIVGCRSAPEPQPEPEITEPEPQEPTIPELTVAEVFSDASMEPVPGPGQPEDATGRREDGTYVVREVPFQLSLRLPVVENALPEQARRFISRLNRVEVELVPEPVSAPAVEGDLVSEAAAAAIRQHLQPAERSIVAGVSGYPILVDVPADGLVNNQRYTIRYRTNLTSLDQTGWEDGEPFVLDVPMSAVRLRTPEPDTVSFDWEPQLTWRFRRVGRSGGMLELMVYRQGAGQDEALQVVTREQGSGRYQLDRPLRDRELLSYSARYIREDRFLGQATAIRAYQATAEPDVTPLLASGEPLLVERPLIGWSAIPGAVEYEAEVYVQRPFETPVVTWRGSDPGLRLEPHYIELLQTATGVPTDTFYWRVRAHNAQGVASPWSTVVRSPYKPIAPPMDMVVSPNELVNYRMGSTEGEPDERPPVDVSITRPYRLARYEVTNRLVAELINMAIRRNYVREQDGVLYLRGYDYPLVGLETLDYGTQFGLEVFRGSGGTLLRVAAVVGREGHPAVGISWYGAAAMANALSLADGRNLVYTFESEGVTVYPDRSGYRLPTEAEWEYAASRGLPTSVSDQQPRQINFYRSGDPYEDPSPPHTRAGGPTAPVGVLVNSSDDGVYDLLGNVWEWCHDWYAPDWYSRLAGAAPGGTNRDDEDGNEGRAGAIERGPDGIPVNPAGPESPTPDRFGVVSRVVRGSAWNSRPNEVRPSNRGHFPPTQMSHSVGVRLARTIAPEPPGR